MHESTKQIRNELETIKEQHGGMLDPADVVAFARNKKTALHGQFTWDDSKAAEEYRLWQARQIIRVQVMVVPDSNHTVRAYVSLSDDRGEGGYRDIRTVMANKDMRKSLMAQAMRDMQLFEQKYSVLEELAAVLAAMRNVSKSSNGKHKRQLVHA